MLTPEQAIEWHKAVMRAYPARTPEGQEYTLEQWQQAIWHAIDISSCAPLGQELSAQQWRNHSMAESALLSLMPYDEQDIFLQKRLPISTERLIAWDIPRWAIEIRSGCISRSWGHSVAPMLEFLQHSEIALVGIQLVHPTKEAQATAYKRLLLSFYHKALEPFVKWVEVQQELQSVRWDYGDYVDLYDFLDTMDTLPSKEEWDTTERSINFQDWKRDSIKSYRRLVEIGQIVLFQDPDNWWHTTETDIVQLFLELYELRPPILSGGFRRRPVNRKFNARDTEPLAHALLTALEAECPPPDWLPRL